MEGKNVYIVSLSIIVAGLIIGGAVLFRGAQNETASLEEKVAEEKLPQDAQQPGLVELSAKGHPFIGKKDAAVTIIEANDYECPFCEKFALQEMPELKKKFIDTGKVKFVFRDFPLPFHQNAQKAAEAALCLDKLGIDYYDAYVKLFENRDNLTPDDLKKYAEELGADKNKFSKCLDEGEFEDAVKKDKAEIEKAIRKANVADFGTPAFFINGKPLIGAQPLSAFESAIEEALKEKE